MTDPTTHAGAGTPEPVAATLVNGVAVADRRTLRRVTRAEQDRLSADAGVERRARAARLDLELREQRRAVARHERDADAADKHARIQARRTRRAARRARLVTAVPRWADRALFVLPILFPMAVAWVGQIRFATTVMGWPLAAAIVFAAGFELSTAYVARLDWLSRAAGDSALLFRAATWAFAAGAATMNYWHAAGPGFAPNGEAVSYGLMSITGVVLWELLSTYRHRTALRADGKLPAARPRFGLARWIWFRPLTRVAWLLALRDGYTTTEMAWRTAIGAVELYGSPKHARNAVRSGRPVPRPEPLDERDDDRYDERNNAVPSATGDRDRPWDRDGNRDTPPRDTRPPDSSQHNNPVPSPDRDVQRILVPTNGLPTDTDAADRRVAPAVGRPQTDQTEDIDRDADAGVNGSAHIERRNGTRARDPLKSSSDPGDPTDNPQHSNGRRQPINGAVRARMEAFIRASRASGDQITGADLDRRFGTRDYGRKVLRDVLATDDRGPAARLKRIAATARTTRSGETP